MALAVGWLVGGAVGFGAVASSTEVGHGVNQHIGTPGVIALLIWMGPFAVALIGAGLVSVVRSRHAWLPRRETVASDDDDPTADWVKGLYLDEHITLDEFELAMAAHLADLDPWRAVLEARK